ncbi:MAG: NAD(+) synthase [Gammaproteobacteria bacterium]|nr:NAD(+) synthase [Gammaproteobacteria bacterium]MCW8909306.1 NAD(+) synthase [Gammaproteobacteria bacterium]MCW9006260.1 NAD(+) synthase [Gammaproteobacteria bacterium]MCW9055056.1 NAD(+) synthase [Gammaproteobacteria bacterium]
MIELNDNALSIDYEKEADRICDFLRTTLRTELKRRGLVVAVSGGIDSTCSAALAVRALGKDKVFCLRLPEQDSTKATGDRSQILVDHLGVNYETHNIAGTLEAIGCYKWRDEAIKKVFPKYSADWKNKIVLKGGLEGKYNHFVLVVQTPDGELLEERLPLNEYLTIVAATNYKQRIRKTVEYFHADRLNYAVIGTPNRLEYDQGFFVKNGDGSADIKPIAHLYKTQVYAMARHLGVPESVCDAIPTTDTYSLSQGQDEFYFALPYEKMDYALWALNHQIPAKKLAEYLNVSKDQAELIYKDISTKRRTTAYMHAKPFLVDDVLDF